MQYFLFQASIFPLSAATFCICVNVLIEFFGLCEEGILYVKVHFEKLSDWRVLASCCFLPLLFTALLSHLLSYPVVLNGEVPFHVAPRKESSAELLPPIFGGRHRFAPDLSYKIFLSH